MERAGAPRGPELLLRGAADLLRRPESPAAELRGFGDLHAIGAGRDRGSAPFAGSPQRLLLPAGVGLERVDDAVAVLAVADRGPAAKAGVAPGDRLVSVNDTSVAGLDVKTVALRLAGDKG